MKLSIRWKLMLFIAGISLAVLIFLAYSIYTVSYKKVYSSFLENNFTLIKAIARSIDGDVHKELLSTDDIDKHEYKRLQKYLNKLKSDYDAITYLYTINYNENDKNFYYCIDGDIAENNILWIETDKFAIEINFDSLNCCYFTYKQKKYYDNLTVQLDDLQFNLTLVKNDSSINVLLNNQQFAEVFNNEIFSVKINSKSLNYENRGFVETLRIGEQEFDAYLSLSIKGEALTVPGDLFEETSENIELYKKILHDGTDYISKNLTEGIYGSCITAVAPIKDSTEKPIGLACLEVYEKEVIEFKKSFTRITIIISIVSVLLMLTLVPFLLEFFVVNKIKKINNGINRIAHKELDTKISIKSKDEFENVANGFNLMASKLKEFYETLEFMVRERTETIEQQNEELSVQTECIKEVNSLLIAKNAEIEGQKEKIEAQNDFLKQINEKLSQSEESLKLLVQTKDKLFSIIAHDLRGPFQALFSVTSELSKYIDEFDKNEIIEKSNQIYTSSNRLLDLIENLLNWSRSQRGAIVLEPKKLQLSELASEVVGILSMQANAKGIKILNEIEQNLLAMADKDTVSTVIRNLTSNAIKYTHSGGKVTLNASKQSDNVVVKVSDTGVGISPENLKKLFKVEENYTTKGTNKESGTGLGLIVCREFIEKNGGTISVESVEGQGTTFIFSLPAVS